MDMKIGIPGIILIFILCLQSCQTPQDEADPRPNVILFFTDELQFSDLGCYGGAIPTPNIDQLAAEGVRFTRAYTPASMCTPSRYAVLTGQFPGRCQASSFLNSNPKTEPYSIAWNTWLRPNQETLPRMLSQNGYFTGMAGKWHVGKVPEDVKLPVFERSDNPADPEVQKKLAIQQAIYRSLVKEHAGFDFAASVLWGNFDGHPVDALRFHNFPWMTKGALDFLDEAAQKDKPFFLYFTPTAIHGPNHVEDLEKDVTLTLEGKMEEVLPYQLDRAQLKEYLANLPQGGKHRYAGMAQIDHQLELIRTKLDSLGLAENTVILFMSDHNIEPGKATSYEKGIHIPMIASWPGKASGQTSEALVENVDVLPTVLEAAGVSLPEAGIFDGTSFLSLMDDPTSDIRPYLFSENGYTRSVTNGRFKYIALRYPESLISAMKIGTLKHVPSYVKTWPQAHSAIAIQAFPNYFEQDQLYDLETDPYELQNLVKEPAHAEILNELKQALEEHLQTFEHPFSLEPIPFLEKERYQELQAVNRSFDLYSIPWLSRDHGGIKWPPAGE